MNRTIILLWLLLIVVPVGNTGSVHHCHKYYDGSHVTVKYGHIDADNYIDYAYVSSFHMESTDTYDFSWSATTVSIFIYRNGSPVASKTCYG